MDYTQYKIEKNLPPSFPIYFSKQSGRETLVYYHCHSSMEIMKVLEGRIKLRIGAIDYECEKGDIIFVLPSMLHGVTSLTEDAAIEGIVFETSLIDMPSIQVDFSELFRRNHHIQYIIKENDEIYDEMNMYIGKILKVYGTFSANARIHLAAYLLMIMGLLISKYLLEISIHDTDYKKLVPVLQYIDTHYTEKIQISELSNLIHVCDDRLIRLFKDVIGETPVEYIVSIRVEQALKLLMEDDLSIAEIAERSGFGSATYMSRVFKQKLGVTPGKCRQKGE